MAKAADNSTTSWILLHDAKVMVAEIYQSSSLTETLLTRWLAAGDVRWRCLGLEGSKKESDPDIGDPEFWRETNSGPGGPGPRIIVLRVNWSESLARRNGMMGYVAYRIEIAREDIDKLLPGVAEPTTIKAGGFVHSAPWIADEVARMKAAGEILAGTTRTAFAKDLADRMRKAADLDQSIRPIKWKSIDNRLTEWGLWPINSA